MTESPHILLTGGGTLGPVTPLLAVAEVWRGKDETVDFSWIGTKRGPERALVEAYRIPFFSLTAPKLDRHRKWKWPFIPLFMLWSLYRSWQLLRKIEPDVVMSAGGYVSVPVVIMARLMGMYVWIHQLDRVPGLANRMMAPFAHRVSVTVDESLEAFSEKKRLDVGAVVRPGMWQGDSKQARQKLSLPKQDGRLTILVFGGGTGAQSLNDMMAAIGSDLVDKMDVIHLTGKGKWDPIFETFGDRYVALEFLGAGMANALTLADIVVGRAGMGTVMELSVLKKPSILLPLPNTDQLGNARMLEECDAAKIVRSANPQILKQEIERLVEDDQLRHTYGRRIGMLFYAHGAEKIVDELRRVLRPRTVLDEESMHGDADEETY